MADEKFAKDGYSKMSEPVDYSKAVKLPQIAAALSAGFAAFILGSTLGWTSPVFYQFATNQTEFHLDTEQQSWVACLVGVGALPGVMVGGKLIDLFGRKTILIFLSVPYAVGWLLIIVANNAGMLYAGRFICGLSCGLCSVATPAYIGEISTPSIRGSLGSLFQLGIGLGGLFCSCIGLVLFWRWISVACAVLPVIFLICMLFVPESPYYLQKKGRQNDACLALKWLRGPAYDIQPELDQIQSRVQRENSIVYRLSDLKEPWALKPLLCALGLMIYQQLSGVNPAGFFQSSIFLDAGSSLPPLICGIITSVVQVSMTGVSGILIERLGRRFLLVVSGFLIFVFMGILGAYFYIKAHDEALAEQIGWLPLFALVMFLMSFSIGVGPIPYVMAFEMIPSKVKGPAASIAVFVNWFLAVVFLKFFGQMQLAMTPAGTFWFFAVTSLISAIVCMIVLPETKGKTPEEIQAYFGPVPEEN